MWKRGNKRGLSDVVTTLVIILISLVAIGVVWVVIQNVIQKGSEQVELGQFTLDLQIKAVQVQDENVTIVIVKRNPGEGEFVGMNFIFSDGQNSEIIRENTTLQELDQRSFTITLSEINTSNLIVKNNNLLYSKYKCVESAHSLSRLYL